MKNKSILITLVLLAASLLTGFLFTYISLQKSLSKYGDVDCNSYILEGVEQGINSGDYFVTSEDGNGSITYELDNQYIHNVKILVNGFSSAEDEINAHVVMLSDEQEIYNSQNVKVNAQPQHPFGVARTVFLDKNTETFTVSFENARDASVTLLFNTEDHFNYFRFWMITLVTFLVLCFVIAFIKYNNLNIEICAIGIVGMLGIVFALYVPTEYTYDEESHYIRAYNVAIHNWIYDYDEVEEYPVSVEMLHGMTWISDNYEDYCNYIDDMNQYRLNQTELKIVNTPQVVYTPLPYIASGIGVKIAKILDFSIVRSVQMARLGNVLLYVLMAFFAIKIMPKKKLLLLFYYAMPINVFLASSLGTDYLINGLVGLALAIIYYVKNSENRMSLQMYVLLLLILCSIPCAKSTYAPMILLIGTLREEELPKNIKVVHNYLVAIILMFLMFTITYLYGSRYGISLWNRENVDSAQQISYIIHNPVNAFGVFLKATWDYAESNILRKYVSFAYLGNVEDLYYYEISGLLLLTIVKEKEVADNRLLKLKACNWICMFLSILGCYALSMLALYVTFTTIGADYVDGFQGRYCISLAIIFYFCMEYCGKIKLEMKSHRLQVLACFGIILVTYLKMLNLIGIYV